MKVLIIIYLLLVGFFSIITFINNFKMKNKLKKKQKNSLVDSEAMKILGSKWDFSQEGKSFVIPYQKPKK